MSKILGSYITFVTDEYGEFVTIDLDSMVWSYECGNMPEYNGTYRIIGNRRRGGKRQGVIVYHFANVPTVLMQECFKRVGFEIVDIVMEEEKF